MPNIIFQSDLCFETSTQPSVTGCDDASRIEWEVVQKPLGSQVIFSDDTIADPIINVSLDGEYIFKVSCYFDEGIVSADLTPATQGISCPLGVVAGQPATVYLTGCEDGNVLNVIAGGVATGATFDGSGVGTVTTSATMPGIATVSLDCTIYDDDFVETTTQLSCEFEVIAADIDLACTTSPAISSDFITCGQICLSDEVTVVFDCENTECQTAQIGLVFKECPECIEDEECEPLEAVELIGVERVSLSTCAEPFEIACETICCEPHMPVLFWNNLCSCPGWTLEGPAIEGSSVYNTCSCNPGQKWCFDGSATLVASGPPQFVDVMVIWGHNIVSGSVTTAPLQKFGGGATDIELVSDAACIEGYTAPIVINFDGVDGPITDFTATIASADGGPVCIDQIFIGQKLFLPDDRLPESFQNPHNGCDYELEFTSSECGPLSRSLKHTPVDLSFDIECIDEEWMCEVWRPYLRYAKRHGVLFQWSRNRKPEDVFNGWFEGTTGPSSYSDPHYQTISLSAKGYISQPQTKVFE